MGGETAAHTTGNFQRHLMDIKLCKRNLKKLSFSTCLYMAHLVLKAKCGEQRLSRVLVLRCTNLSCLVQLICKNEHF